MKKILLLSAAFLTLLSCSSSVPSSVEEFDNAAREMVEKADSEFTAAKEKLSGKQLEEKFEEIQDNLYADYIDLSCRVLKKSKDPELCVHALSEASPLMEPEEILEVINGLPEDIRSEEGIAQILASAQKQISVAEGKMFVDFEAGGAAFSDFIGKGKYVLVDFWASWCGPCKREIPNIKAVYEKYAGEKFDVLSVAVWDKPEDTAAAALEHGVVWNQMTGTGNAATDAYGITSIPQIMLFGPDGTILKKGLRGEGIAEALAEVLK